MKWADCRCCAGIGATLPPDELPPDEVEEVLDGDAHGSLGDGEPLADGVGYDVADGVGAPPAPSWVAAVGLPDGSGSAVDELDDDADGGAEDAMAHNAFCTGDGEPDGDEESCVHRSGV